MNRHLSQEEFASCFVGSGEPHHHLAECPECREELARFGSTVSALRNAIRSQAEGRAMRIQPPGRRMPRVRRAMAAAAVVLLGLVPLLTSQRPQEVLTEASSQADADALMNAINQHLSRTVASPMEPMMSLLPRDEFITGWGGVQ